jgi:hypothetical protein
LWELLSLSELQFRDKVLLQMVLIGRPELEAKLSDPALQSFRPRFAVWHRVEPLTADEVGAYIQRRLTEAGLRRPGLFQPAAVEKIFIYSKGVPGLVNLICHQALAAAYADSQRSVGAEKIDKVWRNLELTGESKYEVAALLADIRRTSQCAGEQSNNVQAKTRAAAKTRAGTGSTEWRIGATNPAGAPRRKPLGRVAFATVAVLLSLAGAVAIIYNNQSEPSGAGPYEMASTEPANDAGVEPSRDALDLPLVKENLPPREPATSLKAAGPAKAPIIYVQTSEERDRSLLNEIGEILRVDGFAVRDTRLAQARTGGDVRFFFPEDRVLAERVKTLFQSELGKRGYPLSLQLLERDGKKFEHAAPGKIEVWLPPLDTAHRTG